MRLKNGVLFVMNETDKEKKNSRNKLKGGCPVSEHDPILCLPELKTELNLFPDIRNTLLASQNIWGVFYGVIYILIDIANGFVYIGQTIRTLRDRFKDHLQYPSNKFLKRAFDRYNYNLKIQKISASAEQICPNDEKHWP